MAKGKSKREMDKFIVDDEDDQEEYNNNVKTEDEDEESDSSGGPAVKSSSKSKSAKSASKAKKGKAKEQPVKRRKMESDDDNADRASDGGDDDEATKNKVPEIRKWTASEADRVIVSSGTTSKAKAKSNNGTPARSTNLKADTSKPALRMTMNDAGDPFGDLGYNKRITVRDFKGKTLIDIREFYEDKNTEEMKPGKKGISLTTEQWETLKEMLGAVDLEIEKLDGHKPAGKKKPKSPKYVDDSD